MANPISVAIKGKGFLPMLARASTLTSRYGLTAKKMDRALGRLALILHRYSCSATLPITATALTANPALGKKLHRQGMEAAIHGLQHVDYSALPLETQIDHVRKAAAIFQRLGITAAGFRCPYLRWNADTLAALSSLGILYDSSQGLVWDVVESSETEEYQHVLRFYRSQPAREIPSLPRMAGGLVRIPYCLPDDESLVERLHLRGGAIGAAWLAMFDCIHEAGELFTLGLHPERMDVCAAGLEAVLQKARSLSPHVWITRLDAVASWYRALGAAAVTLRSDGGGAYHVQVDAPSDAAVLLRGLECSAATQPWQNGYRLAPTGGFSVRCPKRPVIGISPDAAPQLMQFLRHQGYPVEVSTQPELYSIYLPQTSLQETGERTLLNHIEQTDEPLIRLSRWPHGAQSALVVTGDVDAFTLLDYGRRIFYR